MTVTKHSFAAQELEDGQVSKVRRFDYAGLAARAEQKIIELLDKSLRDELADTPTMGLQKHAQPRQGSRSSG